MRNLAVVLAVVGLVAASSFGAVNVTLKAKVGSTIYTDQVPASAFTPGVPVTLLVYAQSMQAGSGVLGLAGDIVPSGAASLSTPTAGATWSVSSLNAPLYAGDGFGGQGSQIGSYKLYNTSTSFAGSLPTAQFTQGDYVVTDDTVTGYDIPTTAVVAHQGAVQVVNNSNNWSVTGFNIGGLPAANGGMSGLGSGQAPSASLNQSLWVSTPGLAASYSFTWNSANGATTLSWVDAGKANATNYGGWFTTGTATGDDTVGAIANITFLPEPATMTLLALGGLLIARRRRA